MIILSQITITMSKNNPKPAEILRKYLAKKNKKDAKKSKANSN